MAIPSLQEQIAAVDAAYKQTASAGQVAQDDGSTGVQNPALPTTAEGRITNVEQTNASLLNSQYTATNGSTADTLSTTTSQATPTDGVPVIPASQVNQNLAAGLTDVSTPATQPGASAPKDDNTGPSSNTTQQTINSTFTAPITPQANILDQYSSYTYSISWYMLTKNQFKALETSRNTAGWSLLVQSGGAPVGGPTASTPGRNPYFNLDYYLDNLSIVTKCMKGTRLAHTAAEMSFTVTEPNGITLMENLYRAVADQWKQNPGQYPTTPGVKPNYMSTIYCLVIKFYGYDQNGNLVTVGKNASTGKNTIVEKYYPFLLTDMTFRVANKQIEYAIKCKPVPYMLQLGQNRSTIPFNYEFVGTTVDDILNGKAATNTTAPDTQGRPSSPQPQTATQPTPGTPAPVNNQVNTLPTPANASNAYVDSTGVDFSQLSG